MRETPGGGAQPVGESFYGNAQRKFRRREGHGPVRMARKQRIWEDWENWKAAKQREMRDQTSQSRDKERTRRRKLAEKRSGTSRWLVTFEQMEEDKEGDCHPHPPRRTRHGSNTSTENGSK